MANTKSDAMIYDLFSQCKCMRVYIDQISPCRLHGYIHVGWMNIAHVYNASHMIHKLPCQNIVGV